MKSKGITKYIALSFFGFIVLITGIVLMVSLPNPQGIMLTLPYICVGIGSGIFGGGLGTSIRLYLLTKDPSAFKQNEIEVKDERNIAIRSKAKAKAFELTRIVFCVLILVFAMLQVEKFVLLTMAAVYLLITLSTVFFFNKYYREM